MGETMMQIPMAAPGRQYEYLEQEIDAAVRSTLASGQYIGGEAVERLEQAFTTYLGGEDTCVVTCANGTDALELAYEAIGLVSGDEVIVPTHNYVAAAEAALRLGLVPVWADCSGRAFTPAQQYNIDPYALEQLITARTRAIVAVNLYGMPIDVEALRTLCDAHRLVLIEDNAQGLGGYTTLRSGERANMGLLGDISTTSFFPTKPLGCAGDGGAIVTRHAEWAERARTLARHGQGEQKYDYRMIGRNSRLDSLQAAILAVKLRHLDEFVTQTQHIAARYSSALESYEGLSLPRAEGASPTYHQYTLTLDERYDREAIRGGLIARGIASGLYYPKPLHQYPIYSARGVRRASLSESERISRQMLSLPVFPLMQASEVDYVLSVLCDLLR